MFQSRRHTRHQRQTAYRASLFALLSSAALAQDSKRGFAYIGDTHVPDNHLLTSTNSPLKCLEFIPMVHGIDATKDPQTEVVIKGLPSSSTHLLSFNEPDGSQGSGGSSISPKDAAKAYIDYVVPFREGKSGGGRKWKISHPSTTGSPNGLDWLRRFNESCYDIDSKNGCPADFVAAHWYGNFDGLKSWLGSLDEFYNTNSTRNEKLPIWVTEMALPQQNAQDTVGMMNQTLPYLDKLDYVERYSWFGAFRTDDANEWTGDGVALFDGHGGLTALGALYMGNGFKVGQKGEGVEDAASGLRVSVGLMAALCVWSAVFSLL
ncbi:hypothetical protein EJ02DRAFT_88949 [Clathrospora elynae]|uniref:Asl1-like glycosyl hydrolase catalytic domain-containing protein n=1 Tax=Clathrospora elynae TaxID=706981 RepID=A0A6A5T346_9PLEO|nr:hypothetical protein EJ02DRAFT_88949 [Clathrospora elynae]